MFTSVAYAMGGSGAQGNSPEAMFTSMVPFLLMIGIFYFLLIRPQQKRAKEHKSMLQALKKGDTVITNAGFIGRILELDDTTLTVDLGDSKVVLGRSYVAGLTDVKLKTSARDRREEKKSSRSEEKKLEEKKTEEKKTEEAVAARTPDPADQQEQAGVDLQK
jgi:preprotein translocase subunit YajC